jgi:thiol-disulfide isomerase/thioredoxin
MKARKLGLVGFVAVILLCGCGTRFEPFPFDFAVTDVEGRDQRLADYRGQVVVVDFWGTWCPPCRASIPSFVRLQEQYGAQGLQVLGLNFEEGSPATAREAVAQFVAAHGINYPCALGTSEILAQVPDFDGFPTTLFLDKRGQVRARQVGLHSYAQLEAVVQTLLAE